MCRMCLLNHFSTSAISEIKHEHFIIYTTDHKFKRSFILHAICGAWGSVVVKALRYKSVGPGIDSKR